MQQYIYGNIGHKGYRYVSSEPEFFADGQRTSVLRHLVNYDVTCPHGELGAGEHQSYWMAVSNLDNPAAPDRLYFQASGGDPFRSGYYAQGYMSDSGDGYLYDSRLLRLLRTQFAEFSQTMAVAEAENLQRIDCDAIPVQADLQSAPLDKELLRNLLLALLQKKKVILRLPVAGREAMRMSRDYILAIYERLPYEQRVVNGFVTGISAAKLHDQVALPAVVKIMLMDADAEFDGVKSNAYQAVFDLADPNYTVSPMPRTNREGKPLAYVPLIDFLAEQTPGELDEFFSFCRSCMRKDVNGNSLSILDYSMYLDFFAIGRGECSDNSIRSWAANVFGNANSNSKWTPEIKKVLYTRIATALTPERLETYLLSSVSTFADLATLGVVDEAEQSQLRTKKGSDVTVRDIHAALTLKMVELLMPYYNEGTEERLIRALDSRFVELGCSQYPFLQAEKPTGATVRLLEQLVLPAGSGKTTALVTALREQVHGKLLALRDQTIRRYQEQFAIQSGAGLARIGQWPGAAWESARQLYEDLKDNYLFEELIASDSTSGWNDAIGGRLAAVCAESVPGAQAEYAGLLSFVRESCDCFGAHGGQLSQTHQAAVTGATEGWQYVLALQEPAQNPAAAMDAQMAALEKAGFLLDHYPKEQRNALAGMVAARLIMLGKAAYPCLTEEKPTAQTVKALQQLPLPQAAEAQTSLVELLRDKIYEHLRQLRETVTRDYENQYAQQHCTGLAQIGQWCAGRYEGIAALFETLHQHYLFEELMAAAGDDCWNTAIGNRLVALCRGAEPRKLQDYKVLLAWADQSRGALEQQGGNLSAQQIADVDGVKAGWNHVLELSERKCDSLAALLKLFADIRATAMDASLAASLMEAGMEPLAEKGISREEIFGNLPKLLKAAAAAPAGQLLRRLVCSCGELRQIAPDAAPEQIAQHLGNCVQLEAAGLMEGGILFPAWKAEAPAEKLYKLLQLLMNYRAGNPEPKFGNRHVRDWAAEKLQGNTDLMYRMAIRFPAYREKLIPVLARKSGAVSRDQLRELYVSGCRKSLLCQGALANTSASWQRHIEELFPEWPQLGQPCQMVLSAERKTCRTNLIIQMLLLVLAGLVPGAAMLLTGVFSMAVSAIWLAVLIVILAVCEIVSFVAHNRLQCRFARWLGLGTLPGIILTIVVLIIHFV